MSIKDNKVTDLLLWQMAFTVFNTEAGITTRLKEEVNKISIENLSPDNLKAKKNLEEALSLSEDRMLRAGKIKKELEDKYII